MSDACEADSMGKFVILKLLMTSNSQCREKMSVTFRRIQLAKDSFSDLQVPADILSRPFGAHQGLS